MESERLLEGLFAVVQRECAWLQMIVVGVKEVVAVWEYFEGKGQ